MYLTRLLRAALISVLLANAILALPAPETPGNADAVAVVSLEKRIGRIPSFRAPKLKDDDVGSGSVVKNKGKKADPASPANPACALVRARSWVSVLLRVPAISKRCLVVPSTVRPVHHKLYTDMPGVPVELQPSVRKVLESIQKPTSATPDSILYTGMGEEGWKFFEPYLNSQRPRPHTWYEKKEEDSTLGKELQNLETREAALRGGETPVSSYIASLVISTIASEQCGRPLKLVTWRDPVRSPTPGTVPKPVAQSFFGEPEAAMVTHPPSCVPQIDLIVLAPALKNGQVQIETMVEGWWSSALHSPMGTMPGTTNIGVWPSFEGATLTPRQKQPGGTPPPTTAPVSVLDPAPADASPGLLQTVSNCFMGYCF
jgi:hypothetical protein